MTFGRRLIVFSLACSAWLVLAASPTTAQAASPDQAAAADFFERQVQPILVGYCFDCHSADSERSGELRLDDPLSVLRGGESGPAIVPGKPAKSLLIKAVKYSDESLQMPPDEKLSDEQIAVLTRWIRDGAGWPEKKPPAAGDPAVDPVPDPDKLAALDFFEKKVRPLLVNNCYNCHSANTNSRGGLRVDDRNGLVRGGDRGPAVVPGSPDDSLLIKAVLHTDKKLQMPPKKQLTTEQIADLKKWIEDGAAWPEVRVPVAIGKPNAKYDQLRQQHWAWQPLQAAAPPPVTDEAWVRDDVDRFLLARLEREGLEPVGDADKITLLRRATFDLTGLPPSVEQLEAFLADESPEALATVVDRLLASPAFGEKWGRHWLDVARYGESTGSARNLPYPHAWRYRDYVIDAVNHDKPYDQFVREQVAGDLLPAETPQQRSEQLIATGFLALGVKDVNQRFKVRYVMDNIDEQIDTVTRSVLGLTASCARCHDHKYDPIPTTEYYALAGIFHSSELCDGLRNKMGGGGLDYYNTQALLFLDEERERDSELEDEIQRKQAALAKARKEVARLSNEPDDETSDADREQLLQAARKRVREIQAELNALADPATRRQIALGVRDADTIGDTELRVRGEAEQLGPLVPRGFLSLLTIPDQPPIDPSQSGRLELAQWLTSEHNPLTPRVMANRIWQRLFGRGLVSSVDNFGVTGDTPSHPELLDYLATRLMRDGWSVKQAVRKLMLSRAYGLSSDATQSHLEIDPANRLVWRHSPRRLQAEEIRDTMLVVAGTLNASRPEASPAKDFKVIELQSNSALAKSLETEAQASLDRSLYLPLLRGLTPTALAVFDFAEQGMVTGSRDTTTVAPQALYLLNDPFVRRQSQAMAQRLLERTDLDDAGRLDWAYRLTLGRPAGTHEIERAISYLVEYEAVFREVSNAPLAQADQEPDSGESAEVATTDSAPDTGEASDNMPRAKNAPVQGNPSTELQTAAWASFCQALLGSAEFRYLK